MMILGEAKRILNAAAEKNVVMRLMGASAIATHSPRFRYLLKEAGRKLTDLDFMGNSKDFDAVRRVMEPLGYQTMRAGFMLSATSVGERSIYVHATNEIKVDAFFDQLRMCHTIDFRRRLNADPVTISLADILLEKMQIVQINEKDLLDSTILLSEHDIGNNDDETVNVDYISSLLSQDWGFYYTVVMNLNKLRDRITKYPFFTQENIENVGKKIDGIRQAIESRPKSSAWKLRARIGTRRKWYVDVEEAIR
jgi:hypothetical protein